MTHTVKLDFWIDSDEIASNEEVKAMLEELLNGTAWNASDVEVLDIND